MTTLPKEYTRNGYTYSLVKRTYYAAMYEMREDLRFVGFEVGRVKVVKDGSIGGKFIEGGERLWSDEDFGRIAFWTNYRDKAEQYYREQHDAGMELAHSKANNS